MRDLESVLRRVKTGELSVEEALRQWNNSQTARSADFGIASIDSDRGGGLGFPAVICGYAKTPGQIAAIFRKHMEHADRVIATRVAPDKAEAVKQAVPEATYHETAGLFTWFKRPILRVHPGFVAVVCAGAYDLPVAEEAAIVCEAMGNQVKRIYDVGASGIPKLFARLDDIRAANAVVVIAGMEGALASVVGGLVAKPIIAVPTSAGYGAHFGGISALLSMLNTCAPGIAVVNIDNGFGAGYYAGLINNRDS
ncbi:MAG TPA: nickel pincer cofactor biosynthesis protein LarB [Bacilli bacterium]